MPELKFTDGIKFNTDGPLRIERRRDGSYVVGNGMLIPIESDAEGQQIISEMSRKKETSDGTTR